MALLTFTTPWQCLPKAHQPALLTQSVSLQLLLKLLLNFGVDSDAVRALMHVVVPIPVVVNAINSVIAVADSVVDAVESLLLLLI